MLATCCNVLSKYNNSDIFFLIMWWLGSIFSKNKSFIWFAPLLFVSPRCQKQKKHWNLCNKAFGVLKLPSIPSARIPPFIITKVSCNSSVNLNEIANWNYIGHYEPNLTRLANLPWKEVMMAIHNLNRTCVTNQEKSLQIYDLFLPIRTNVSMVPLKLTIVMI